MKLSLAAICLFLVHSTLSAQNFNTMTGDWIRVHAEYQDGGKLPRDHQARIFLRFSFTKDQVYMIMGDNTMPSAYTRAGNKLNIGPLLTFNIEKYNSKALTILTGPGEEPVRYYMITLDSAQRMGLFHYSYTVTNADTVYTHMVGIEPIYPKGNTELMNEIFGRLSAMRVGVEYTYVVKKDGTIGDVEIINTSDHKKDQKVIQAIKKSGGKWIPGTLRGKPINVKLKDKIVVQ